MNIDNEYLAIFSDYGDYDVHVKFKNFSGSIASKKMMAGEFMNLISPNDGKFFTKMNFDDWGFLVYKYEIDPVKMIVTIYAKQSGS